MTPKIYVPSEPKSYTMDQNDHANTYFDHLDQIGLHTAAKNKQDALQLTHRFRGKQPSDMYQQAMDLFSQMK